MESSPVEKPDLHQIAVEILPDFEQIDLDRIEYKFKLVVNHPIEPVKMPEKEEIED